jgi:multidrug resistance efflux pump
LVIALVIAVVYIVAFWLVFFKLKLITFSITWAALSSVIFVHVLLVFVIGLHFMTPYTTDAKVVQYTIQLIPRLPEPTLVTAVLVEPNVPVKKGQPLFQFDRRPYEDKVKEQEAALAAARQDVLILNNNVETAKAALTKATAERDAVETQKSILTANLDVAGQALVQATSVRDFASLQYHRAAKLQQEDAEAVEEYQRWEYDLRGKEAAVAEAQTEIEKARFQLKKWDADIAGANAAVKEATDNVERTRLAYGSQFHGVNTRVAGIEATLAQARYYLDNTTMVASENGFITNLQVRPGMVAGTVRFGAIAALIVDADRYVLGTYYQEHLKYVKPGLPVEVAFDLYPGQIFNGTVASIWWASGEGQFLPSGDLPSFNPPAVVPQGRFAVRISLNDPQSPRFPIGAQGAAAIYTTGGAWAALRRISIRTYSWMNWLFPLSL